MYVKSLTASLVILPTILYFPLNEKGAETGTVKQHLECRKSGKDKGAKSKLYLKKFHYLGI